MESYPASFTHESSFVQYATAEHGVISVQETPRATSFVAGLLEPLWPFVE